jgi:hypothetical protein
VTTLEATVRFTAAPWEHVGWGALDFAGPYVLFSTAGSATNLYARSADASGEQRTDLGPIPAGFHVYRVDRAALTSTTDQVSYYVDAVLVAQHAVATLPALYVYQSNNGGTALPLDVDRLWVYPTYVASGTFQSCALDAGSMATWATASWDATTPPGATLTVSARTSPDGAAWSAWSSVPASGSVLASPGGRYFQYQLGFTSGSAASSPVLSAFVLIFGTAAGGPPPFNQLPIAVSDTATVAQGESVTIPVLANDRDPDGDPLTVTTVTQGTLGSVVINLDNTLGYTAGGLCGIDTFTYTISDGRGGTASATVTVACSGGQIVQSTSADFSAFSTFEGTMLTAVGNGEVRLAGSFGDEYAAASLDPARWLSGTWSGGSFTPAPVGGVLSVAGPAGAYVRSATALTVTTLEATAQFTGAPWEHVGWGALDFAGPYLLFSTADSATNLYARSADNRGEQRTDLGPIPVGFHVYRIDRAALTPTTDQVSYYVDGALVAQHTIATLPALYLYQSNNGSATLSLDVDRLWVYPTYVANGTYQSRTLDAGSTVTWTAAIWDATTPAGTTLTVSTRTSDDAVSWSAWSPVTASGSATASPAGRYLQYQVGFASGSPETSPALNSVTLIFSSTAGVPPVSALWF